MKWESTLLTVHITGMTSLEAAEMRLLALENKARLKWLRGGPEAQLTFKNLLHANKFLAGLKAIAGKYS